MYILGCKNRKTASGIQTYHQAWIPDAVFYFSPRNRRGLGARKPGKALIASAMHQVPRENCPGTGGDLVQESLERLFDALQGLRHADVLQPSGHGNAHDEGKDEGENHCQSVAESGDPSIE